MKSAVYSLCALGVSALEVDTEERALPTQFFQSVFNEQYHAASTKDKVISQMPELYNVAPCQYWYDNSWYNMIGTDVTKTQLYSSSGTGNKKVYFTNCQLLSNVDKTVCTTQGSNSYAAESTAASATCTALTTSNLDSITMLDNGYDLGNGQKTLGVNYTDSTTGCFLEVGHICNNTMTSTEYTTTALIENVNGNSCGYRTTITSKDSCAVYSLNSLWAWM